MRLGIDLGTTRTVVAAVDRGNYPLVGFTQEPGSITEWVPSRHEGVTSFKRALGRARLSDPAFGLTCAFIQELSDSLRNRSNLAVADGEKLEAVIGIPANASSTQRFLTVEAFRRAGFDVLSVVNEPSAAGLEYAHRYRRSITSERAHVLVYDLGGGTFDASLIDMGRRDHHVLSSEGIAELGGDDFDRVICDLALEKAGLGRPPPEAERELLAECCLKKESIFPQTKKIMIDLSPVAVGREVVLSVAEVMDRSAPLVSRTIEALLSALHGPEGPLDLESVAGIYVVGGASSLPVVGRMLRERFGRRVHRSPYSFASTAIGLAIAADATSGYELTDCFTRHFGVWREESTGEEAAFDTIFAKDTPLPPAGARPLTCVRRYQAKHNIGHFRFLECSQINAGQVPVGDLMIRREVFFPFHTKLRDDGSLARHAVSRLDHGPLVEERYECAADGIVRVTVTAVEDGYSRTFDLI
jgi:molecular chaperone DnaK (HSP70)